MIRVKARTNESLEQMLRRFKKVCEKEGLTREIKRVAYYEKPSEIRRRKERQLVRKIQKESNTGPFALKVGQTARDRDEKKERERGGRGGPGRGRPRF